MTQVHVQSRADGREYYHRPDQHLHGRLYPPSYWGEGESTGNREVFRVIDGGLAVSV